MRTLLPMLPLTLILAGGAQAQGTLEDPPHDPGNGIYCNTCHITHGSPGASYKTIPGNINLCQSCHNPLGIAPVTTHAPLGAEQSCSDCHDAMTQRQAATHGSTFSKFVRTHIETPNSGVLPVKLLGPTGPNSFADGDGVYDGVCEVCHTGTAYHRNNPSGNHDHNKASDCRQCHPHGAGFQPAGGGGDCLACHNEAQPPGPGYRRQVVEFNGDGNGDFVREVHHVDDGTGNESVTAADCVVCHDQSGHRGHPDPQVRLNDPDGGASHQFNGSAASLTDFCVRCHDFDGQGGNARPFSSPGAPADVAQWWSLDPAHAASPAGAKCFHCHDNGHGADNPSMTSALEANLCFACHDGSVATSLVGEFGKSFRHPIDGQSRVHERKEDPLGMPRHVECEDCHNSHAADGSVVSTPPAISGLLRGVSGIDTGGNAVASADFSYEVCYKCHADTNPGQPALSRVQVETDARVEFDPAQPSFHPIEAAGRNPDVPSLIGGWTKDSVMTCQDCHAGSSGIQGPHGSDWPWILKERYETADFTQESPAAYALCYRCHSRTSILNDESFDDHRKHIEKENTPCSVCHDAHGVAPDSQFDGTHLINFRSGIVRPRANGDLYFRDNGRFSGSCALRCHGKDHDPESY